MNRRTALLTGGAVLLAGVGGWRWWPRPPASAAPDDAAGVTTVAVVRTDLTAREQVPGTLGYSGEWRVDHAGPAGVLTAAPAPGTVVRRGQALYEVDGDPVRLLYGARPAWRDFAPGMNRGEDVRQLERNLAALGFGGYTVDTAFTTATSAAIRRWQRRLGVPRTGRLPLGSVVFAPEAVRVVEVTRGPSVRVSSTRRVVTISLPTARQGQVRPGGQVDVTLPGGQVVPGRVAEVGRVAQPGTGDGPPTIPVTVTLDGAGAGSLDQAPVRVAVTTASREGVLAVPVTALRAADGGGYEVMAVTPPVRLAVAVRPGLLDERAGLIEVTGDGLAEGTLVEVPRP